MNGNPVSITTQEYRAIKIRIYPNQEQKKLLDKTFGCCRFIYNKMLEDRIKIYDKLKEDKQALYNYKYKTEKEYKERYSFLKEVDAKALQSEWRNLKSAYDNFFRNIKKGIKKGFPKFKSKRSKQSYTTYNINDNCKIITENKKIKLPKIKTWIKYKDDRTFKEKIKHITISKTRTNKYYASILMKRDNDITPMQELYENKIVGFDMSANKFLITKEIELINPRFYRMEEKKLRKLHREVSRKKKRSKNREKARIKLSRVYEKIDNRKKDWIHKMTHLLSKHYDCIILEDLNIKGIQQFNSGLSKSITLDFSWNQFVNILKYKMEQKGKHIILIDRFFPSSKMCSKCGQINNDLTLKDRKWKCDNCQTEHERDINASINIRNEGLEILKKRNIKVINNRNTTVGTTGLAFGENVRPIYRQFSMKEESICL